MTSEFFVLYYDDKCPLCIKTVTFIKHWIKPERVSYLAISESNLDESDRLRALEEMLFVSSSGQRFWGFVTYMMLFRKSGGLISPLLRCIAYAAFHSKMIQRIGQLVYIRIAMSRARCEDDGCSLDDKG